MSKVQDRIELLFATQAESKVFRDNAHILAEFVVDSLPTLLDQTKNFAINVEVTITSDSGSVVVSRNPVEGNYRFLALNSATGDDTKSIVFQLIPNQPLVRLNGLAVADALQQVIIAHSKLQ